MTDRLPDCAQHLQHLRFPDATLYSDHIRLYSAAFPNIQELEVLSLQPDSDLAELPCTWSEVKVIYYMDLDHLHALPKGIQELHFRWAFPTVQATAGRPWFHKYAASLRIRSLSDMQQAVRWLQKADKLLTERPDWAPVGMFEVDVDPDRVGGVERLSPLLGALIPLQMYVGLMRLPTRRVAELCSQALPLVSEFEYKYT